jgi:hypothetical protein
LISLGERTVGFRGNAEIVINMNQLASRIENIKVTTDLNDSDVLSPDPVEKVFVRQDLVDAIPGLPGARYPFLAIRLKRHPAESGTAIFCAGCGGKSWRTDRPIRGSGQLSVAKQAHFRQSTYGLRSHLLSRLPANVPGCSAGHSMSRTPFPDAVRLKNGKTIAVFRL